MDNILIINLRRHGDILAMGHLIYSMRKINPQAQISILVYRENIDSARLIKGVNNVFTIERKEIITLKKNKIFSNGFSLQKLLDDVSCVKDIGWNKIINYSNDKASAYLSRYIAGENTVINGIHANRNNMMVPNGNWDIVFNDLTPEIQETSFNFNELYHQMTKTPICLGTDKLKIEDKSFEVAKNNIMAIKQKSDKNHNSDATIIGIQLKTSSIHKDIPKETIIEVLQSIIEDPAYFPILLIGPFEVERKIANDINSFFNNSLVVAESDMKALPSLVKNLDILLTPDTMTKHIADLVGTPCIEVSLGESPFLKQGTINPFSVILTNLASTRQYTNGKQINNITSKDILMALTYLQYPQVLPNLQMSPDVTMYSPIIDEAGMRHRAIAGTIDTEFEITRLMSRQLLSKILTGKEISTIEIELNNYDRKTLSLWIKAEKEFLTHISKGVLSCLKSIIQIKDGQNKINQFASNLDSLMTNSSSSYASCIPLKILAAKLNTLTGNDTKAKITVIESELYNVKDGIQLLIEEFTKYESGKSFPKIQQERSYELNS